MTLWTSGGVEGTLDLVHGKAFEVPLVAPLTARYV